jgi:hypothetical protein
MEILAGILIFVGLGVFAWGVIYFLVAVMKAFTSPVSPNTTNTTEAQNNSDTIDGMNEGDYHSGPHGYSPMTSYPETQYGSGFDPDAEWNHEEND